MNGNANGHTHTHTHTHAHTHTSTRHGHTLIHRMWAHTHTCLYGNKTEQSSKGVFDAKYYLQILSKVHVIAVATRRQQQQQQATTRESPPPLPSSSGQKRYQRGPPLQERRTQGRRRCEPCDPRAKMEMFGCHSNRGTSEELLNAPSTTYTHTRPHWGLLEDSWGVEMQREKSLW